MLTTSTLEITNLITENKDVINKNVINEESCYCNNNIKIYPSKDFVEFKTYNTTNKLKKYTAKAIEAKNTELIDINDIALSTKKAKNEHFKSSESYRFLSFHSPSSMTNKICKLNDNIYSEINEHESKSLINIKTAIFKGIYYSQFHIDENNYGNINYMPTFCHGCCKLWFFLEDNTQRSKKRLFKKLEPYKHNHDKHGELLYIIKNISQFLVIKQVPGMVLEFLPGGFPHAVLTLFEPNRNLEEITIQVALITATERAFLGNVTEPTSFGRRMTFEGPTLNYNEWKSNKIDELKSLKNEGNFLFISEFSE
jgi:hypothetical protein